MSKVAFTSPTIAGVLDGWHWVALRDVVHFTQYGLSVRGRLTGKYPMLRMNNIINGKISTDTLQYVDLDDQTFARHRLVDGDILFNRTNSFELVGKCAYVENIKDSVFASYLVRVVPDSAHVDGRFLSYYLNAPETQARLKQLATRGVSQSNISAAKLKLLKIKLPPIEEQRAIAHVLRTIQQAKEATEKVIAAARQLKASLMRHLFTYGPVPFAEADKVPLKETEIGTIREDWKIVRISTLAQLITKGASPKWQGFDYISSGVVFVRSQNVGWGRIDLDDIVYLPESWNRKEKRSIIATGDLLINIVGASIGRAAVATESVDGGNLNQAVALVRMANEHNERLPKYVMYFLLSEQGQIQLHLQEKEIARANLSLQDIGRLPVPLMDDADLRKTVEVLSSIDKKVQAEENKRQTLDVLFKTLLHNLMTGAIRLKEFARPVAAEVI